MQRLTQHPYAAVVLHGSDPSKLWQPESWPDEDSYPTTAEAAFAHVRRRIPSLTLEEVEQSQADAIRYRLL